MNPARSKTAAMYRIRNEARWIRRSLERTFEVAKTVVLWDDGSDDLTRSEAEAALGRPKWIAEGIAMSDDGTKVLHYIRSPFRHHVFRTKEAVNEIRDKNCLWAYCKVAVDFSYMLCLDGDEILSREAIRNFPQAIEQMERIDILSIPFVYLWDGEDQCRVDAIYGPIPNSDPPYARLHFPRLFTIARLDSNTLFDTCFMWFGTQGSMHCGSIPRQNFRPLGQEPTSELARLPVIHMGYIDEDIRQRKYVFYNTVDPNNESEGCYRHIIGLPEIHAPGPVELAPWVDA